MFVQVSTTDTAKSSPLRPSELLLSVNNRDSRTACKWAWCFKQVSPLPNTNLHNVTNLLITTVFLYCSEFGGLAANLVAAADHSAVKLVKLVLMHFPGNILMYILISMFVLFIIFCFLWWNDNRVS